MDVVLTWSWTSVRIQSLDQVTLMDRPTASSFLHAIPISSLTQNLYQLQIGKYPIIVKVLLNIVI